jgi:putative redox protein
MTTIIRRLEPIKDRPLRSRETTENCESDAAPTSHALFIIPTRRGDGFQASIHGHMLDLADPTDHRLAPSPDDLLIASIASDLAWSARRFLCAHGLPDDVSVSAQWQTTEGLPSLADITLTVTVSRRAKAVSEALAASFENSLAARTLAEPVVHISLEGGNR